LLLDDPAYASVAHTISEEIAQMPGPEEIVRVLERLADTSR
jgi:hypothetical protein